MDRGRVVLVFAGAVLALAPGWLAGVPTSRGCQYAPSNISSISYRFWDMYDAYETAFQSGAQAWNSMDAVPGHFTSSPSSTDPEIDVYDSVFAGTDWAQSIYSSCSGGYYYSNESLIRFDTVDMGQLTSTQRSIVARHEIGHAYGLAHIGTTCHVMRQGTDKFTCGTMPTGHDADGVRALYP